MIKNDRKNELYYQVKDTKICRVSTVPFFIVSQLKMQFEYIKDFGMQVIIVASDGPEWDKINEEPRLQIKKINIARRLEPLKDMIALLQLIRFFYDQRFDIVHSTTPKAGLLTAIAGKIVGVPIRLHTFTGQPWVGLNGFMRWFSRAADMIIAKLNTKCYADSVSQMKFLISEGIIVSDKIAVFGLGSLAGVDTYRFNKNCISTIEKKQLRKSLSISDNSKVIIFVGRISEEKGVIELISAFLRIVDLNYDIDLILVGPRDQDCGVNSSIDINSVLTNPKIHYIGYTQCPEKYLSISDIFCLPSYREGFGTVVIEAAAMGLPTVGTKINGLIDAIEDGVSGILVRPRDVSALLQALKRLLDNPSELNRMGIEAKYRCQKNFEAKDINFKIVCDYWDLLKKHTQKLSEA